MQKRKEVSKLNVAKISEKLIQLRGNKSQEMVAREIGISTSALSMYETANRIPKDEIKIKIANYYNTTVQSIFFEE